MKSLMYALRFANAARVRLDGPTNTVIAATIA
jgi:hypothetical protein